MADERFLETLWTVIESRKAPGADEKSYTRSLLESPARARKKVIEEAYEVAEAHQGLLAAQDTREHLAGEAADLVYHLLVLLSTAGLAPADVWAVLQARHGAPRRG
jgi:phosphoribosyl-ATP pyrophosphohydrolase